MNKWEFQTREDIINNVNQSALNSISNAIFNELLVSETEKLAVIVGIMTLHNEIIDQLTEKPDPKYDPNL